MTATTGDTPAARIARLRTALTAALGSGDRKAAAALRSALAAIANAEAIDPATDGSQAVAPAAASVHFAGARAGLGATEVTRKQLTAADVTRIVRDEIAERRSAAAQYDRLGRSDQAERLRQEADVLTAVLGPVG